MDAAREPNGATALRRAGKAIRRNPDRHARYQAPVIEDIRGSGHTGLRAVVDELNARGMLTRRGGQWHVSTVTTLLHRLSLGGAASADPG